MFEMNFSSSRTKFSKQVISNVYYYSEFPMLDCNIYVLKDTEGNIALIDTGNGLSLNITLEAIEKDHLDIKKIKKILITHEHLDHVLGLYPLLEMFKNESPEVIAHPNTVAILEEGDEEKICPGSLGISAGQFGIQIVPIKSKAVKNNESITFGEFTFQVIETPGHSLGSVSYYDQKHKIIFPGDVVFPQGSFGRYDFPGGSLDELKKSITKLSELDVDIFCAGHMDPVIGNGKKEIGRSLKNIMYMEW